MSVSSELIRKVVDEARAKQQTQVIGLLTGRMRDSTLVIEEAVTGDFHSDETQATLPGDALARIADDMVNQRIKGNLVGWYHSHVSGGAFMSDKDIETQLKLQQFSPLITAMVVDNQTWQASFFRVNPVTGTPYRIPGEMIYVFGPGEVPLPPAPSTTVTVQPQQTRATIQRPFPTKLVVTVTLLIALMLSGIVLYALSTDITGAPLKLNHQQISTWTVGSPIPVEAKVTGGFRGLQNVSLRYAPIDSTEWRTAQMTQTGTTSTYTYTIPASEVGTDMQYFIIVFDKGGNSVRTEVNRIKIADFKFRDAEYLVTVTRGSASITLRVWLQSINSFSFPVSLQLRTPLAAVRLTVPSSIALAPNEQVSVPISVAATETAAIGVFNVQLDATQSGVFQVTRTTVLKIRITDFAVESIQPTILEVDRGRAATYQLILVIHPGFAESLTSPSQVTFNVTGLPREISWNIIGRVLAVDGSGKIILQYDLTFETTFATLRGTYSFTVTATVGGLARTQQAVLVVR